MCEENILEKVKVVVENSKNNSSDNELSLLKEEYFNKKISYVFDQNNMEEIQKCKIRLISNASDWMGD